MATAKKLTDNHLTCVICTEVFTDPATLQCNHTFCKSCLLKYTKTQPEAIQDKTIPCPSCRQLTRVTNPDSPVEKWGSQLKPSHVIQGLMDDLGESSDTCSVCKEDGETTPGTMWCTICDDVFCDGCLQLHKKMPRLRDHEVIDLRIHSNEKPKAQRFMCRIHKDEKIKLFCKDCRMAICTVCCSIKHRKCDDVETIDTMTPLVKESLITETRNQEKKKKIYTDNISSTNSKIEKLSTNAQEMKDQVQKVCMAAVDVLLKKEKKLLERIDQLTKIRIEEWKAHRKSQEIDLQMHQQRYEFIDKAVTSNCVGDMYDIYETVSVASRDEDTSEDKRPIPSTIVFTHDTDKLRRYVDEVQLGEVKVVQDVSDRTSSPVLLQTIDCRRQGDILAFLGSLFDVAVLVVDGIKVMVVIDSFNSRLHACYTSNKRHIQKCLDLPTGPSQVAKVGGARVAVTLPDTQQIAFINFDPEPTLLSTVKTKRQYNGLACLNSSQLVAGGKDSRASVDVLDMKGNVLKSINTGVIKNPSYIHVTRNNNLIFSNAAVKSLVSATCDGEVVFTYTPTGEKALKYPRGVTTTSTGDILLVDSYSHRVIQLTESGQFVRDVLTQHDGLECPRGICLDDDGLLYVTNYNDVKVFTFCEGLTEIDRHYSVT
ncbi:protein wech-like isoform X2 [Haliotis rufescens]|nr:protein wech-like isoform X2 [Haliotis rufescens]XP_048253790.1 protein wech-like isoform X2 [Haliotis rufescens]